MLVTKFNVKLNQLFILLMRKEFYSDQIYLTGYDSSKSSMSYRTSDMIVKSPPTISTTILDTVK